MRLAPRSQATAEGNDAAAYAAHFGGRQPLGGGGRSCRAIALAALLLLAVGGSAPAASAAAEGADAAAPAEAAGGGADAGSIAEGDAGPSAAPEAGPASGEADKAGPAVDTPGPGAKAAGTAEPAPVLRSTEPVLSGRHLALLRAAWREVQGDLIRGAWGQAAGRHARLVEIRRDLGLPNLPRLSAVLLRAADDAANEGAVDAAESLAEAAGILSPDLAAPRFDRARYMFQRTPFAIGNQLRDVRQGFENVLGDLPAMLALLGNSINAAIYVVIALVGLFSLAMLARYLRFAGNDLRRLLPRGVTRGQSSLLLGVLLAAPFFSGFGLLLTVTLWLVVTSFYQRPMERLATLILLAAVAAMPRATSDVVRALTYPADPMSVIYACNVGICPEADQHKLREWANTHRLPHESNFTAGLALGREAGLHEAGLSRAKAYARTAADLNATAPALTLRGNLEYLTAIEHCRLAVADVPGADARVELALRDALEHWAEAQAADPSYLPAAYNTYIVSTQLGEASAAEQALEQAMNIDTVRVLNWNKEVAREANTTRCRDLDSPNRHVMPPALSAPRLLARMAEREAPESALLVPFGGLFSGRLGPGGVSFGASIALLLVILAWLIARPLRPSRACKDCGAVADPRTRLDVSRGSICERCLLIDIRRAFVDAKEQWFREKERELELSRTARRARLVTWLVPGLGHLLRGAPLRGLLFLGIVLTCVIAGLTLNVIVEDPTRPATVGGGRMFLFAAVGAVSWLLAVLDAHTGGGR